MYCTRQSALICWLAPSLIAYLVRHDAQWRRWRVPQPYPQVVPQGGRPAAPSGTTRPDIHPLATVTTNVASRLTSFLHAATVTTPQFASHPSPLFSFHGVPHRASRSQPRHGAWSRQHRAGPVTRRHRRHLPRGRRVLNRYSSYVDAELTPAYDSHSLQNTAKASRRLFFSFLIFGLLNNGAPMEWPWLADPSPLCHHPVRSTGSGALDGAERLSGLLQHLSGSLGELRLATLLC